ncbi:uncharacterized S-adenosylmethionine-dependent methyltransferase Rv2258c-like [Haliotis rufescens]|uniref:uncharacterized S-adenosylmethionine-dependent methyltransferase Rv2258c-like n=1 Tax=Haliotis rufescens TaxID=6454 RepID=UPI001EAF9F1E|nr:uncharacterized S-adenosylmethionine-dependent methyltransferase Rv2258c-like [Haliotis rufescens]
MYVREILGTLAVGEVISVDDSATQFHVPDDRKGTFDMISVSSRILQQFGSRYDSIKECVQLKNPGGMAYSQCPRVFDVLKEILVVVKKDIIDTDILPSVPLLLTQLESGINVAEFGCATGVILNKLASRFKKSTFLGSDVASEPLVQAREEANIKGLQNVTYDTDNIETISESFKERFDWILTREVIHDLTHPQEALNEIYRCLKPGGIYSMIDVGIEGGITGNIANPSAMFYYSVSSFLCIPESYRKPDSAALGATWGAPLAREMVAKAGFTIINESVSGTDSFEVHFVCKK